MKTIDLGQHLDRFVQDVIADALSSAQARYWRRRAEACEAAIPRDGDFLGKAGTEGVEARTDSLTAKATACRSHARLMLGGDLA